MIRRLPFIEAHFDLIEPDPVFRGVKERMNLRPLMEQGKATSWVDGGTGEVLAMGGYVQRRRNVFWLWFLPGVNGKALLCRCYRFFRGWCERRPAGVRLEATVLASFKPGLRLVEMLGFTRETGEPMRLWDGRGDYHLFAKVTGDGR